MKRREFVVLSVSILATACGASGASVARLMDEEPVAPPEISATIANNHGHRAVLTAEQLASETPVTLDIQGDSGHGHALTLSAENLAALRSGEAVTVTSTTTFGHVHAVELKVVAPQPALVDIVGTVSRNHGHYALLTASQLAGDVVVTLDIKGQASHPHVVEIAPEQLASLRAGESVTVTSSTVGGHAHSVVFAVAQTL